MSLNINAFTDKLADIGVIDSKTKKAIQAVADKGCKDPRFPDFLESLVAEVRGWHEIANSVGYASDPILAKTVSEGMKVILKFAKSNVSNSNIKMSVADEYGKRLAELGMAVKQSEQKLSLNQGGSTVNIRQESLEMLKIYKDAVNQQRTVIAEADTYSLNIINSAYSKLEEIEKSVESAADISSRDAAHLQKDLFTAINSWEYSFAHGNFDRNALAHLDTALKLAQHWAGLPLTLKAKQAKENDYLHKDVIGTRMMNLAGTYDALAKINQAIGLIERAKVTHTQITDYSRLEAQRAENAKDLADFQKRVAEIKYLASTGQIDLRAALKEKEYLEQKAIPTVQKSNQTLDSQIIGMKQRRTALKMTLQQVENVCHNFLSFKNEPRIINLFAEHVDFVALTNFLGGSNTSSTINDIVNLAALEKMTLMEFDKANDMFNQNLDEQMEALEPVNLYEEEEQKQQLSDEDMLKLIMGDGDVDSKVHADNPYKDTEDFGRLSISEDDN